MKSKKSSLILLTLSALIFSSTLIFAASPEGTWVTVDDSTGKKRAVVDMKVTDGVLNGTITQVFAEPGDKGICENCPDAFKDQPIQGMQFVWGLKEDSDGLWSGGQILDPKSGKIYKAKVSLEGNTLLVRGYIGFSLLGRTQTWVKEQ